MDELMKAAISQGLGYALFVFLLIYVLKTTGEREKKYQDVIDKLTDALPVMKADIEEIKGKLK